MENPCNHKHQADEEEPQQCHPVLGGKQQRLTAGHRFCSSGTASCTEGTLLSYRYYFPDVVSACKEMAFYSPLQWGEE